MSFEPKHILLMNDYLEHGESSSTDLEYQQSSSTSPNSSSLPPSYVSVMQQPSVVELPPSSINNAADITQQVTLNQTVLNQPHLPVTQQPSRDVIITSNITLEEPNRLWRNGIFDCCATTSVCLCVCFCPICYGCSLAKRLRETGCLTCCPGGLAIMRYKYRTSNRIQGSAMDDVCLSACCASCVLCQLGNELNLEQERYPKVCCGCC